MPANTISSFPSCTATKEELLHALASENATVLSMCPLCAANELRIPIGLHPSASASQSTSSQQMYTATVDPSSSPVPNAAVCGVVSADATDDIGPGSRSPVVSAADVALVMAVERQSGSNQTTNFASTPAIAVTVTPIRAAEAEPRDKEAGVFSIAGSSWASQPAAAHAVAVHIPPAYPTPAVEPQSILRSKLIAPVFKPPPNAQRIEFANGEVYEGVVVDGRRSGFGRDMFPSGAVYIGRWVNDRRNGLGFQRYEDGTMYEGEWKDNERCGFGSLAASNGDVIMEGDWLTDKLLNSYLD